MPGKRDRKKRERGNDGGGMASFLGIGGGMPGERERERGEYMKLMNLRFQ
jgi:hypothetical protein